MTPDQQHIPDLPLREKQSGFFRFLQSKSRAVRWIAGLCIFGIGFMLVGGVFLVTMDFTDHVFSTYKFCAHTCHVMEDYVAKELEESDHFQGPSGVRAKCKDCHVSRNLSLAMVDHFIGTRELIVWLTHDLDKPGAFDELRPEAADRVRFRMIKDDSKACRGCHDMEAIKPERQRGQNQHNEAMEKGITCIICHYNLAHKAVEPSPEFQKAIEAARGPIEEEDMPPPIELEEGEEVL